MPKRPPPKLASGNSARLQPSFSTPSGLGSSGESPLSVGGVQLPPPPATMSSSSSASSSSTSPSASSASAASLSSDELARQFTALLDARGIKDAAQREQMERLPADAKLTLLQQEKSLNDETMAPETAARITANEAAEAGEFDRVAVLLGSQPVRWVAAFVSAGGLKHVLGMLVRRVRNMKSEAPDQISIDTLCAGVRCLKAMMNAHLEMSIDGLNETKSVGPTLIVCVQLVPPRLAASLLEMLAAMAIATDAGHAALRKPIVASNFLRYTSDALLAASAAGGAPMQIAALTFLNAMLSGFVDDDARTAFVKAMHDGGVVGAITELQRAFVSDDPQLSVQMQLQLEMFANATGVELDADAAADVATTPPPLASTSSGRSGALPPPPNATRAMPTPPPSGATPPRAGVSSLARNAAGGVAGKAKAPSRRAAAGSTQIAAGELTIDRNKSAPDNIAKSLAESLRGTSVEKALPKVLQALGSMRTEGSMAMATWALLGAFVGVVAYMPEPDDGVAAPGELVNKACHLLADEFAVPLTGVGEANPLASSMASTLSLSGTSANGDDGRKLAELQEIAAAAKERAELLEANLATATAAHQQAMADAVGYQMEQDETLAQLRQKINELSGAAATVSTESQGTIDVMATEIDQLRVEVAALRAGGGDAVASIPATASGVDTGTIRKPSRAAPSIDAAAAAASNDEETQALRKRVAELEAQLAAAVAAAPPAAAALEDAPITGGPPPPPMMGGGGGAATAASDEDAPITGGPPPPPMMGGGGGGGAPPPPPPPGGKLAKPIPKKKEIKPGQKMKAFNWTKVAPQKIDGTVWSKVDDAKVSLDAKQLEQLFGIAAVVEKKAPVAAVKQGDAVVTLVDPRRSQNIVIMLSRFKTMTFAQLREAVERCDANVLTPDVIKALRSFVPTADEVELLKEHAATPDAQLGKAEQFLREMSKLPRLDERLDAMLFFVGFQKSFAAVQTEIHILRTACNEIKECKSLPKLLEVMLAVGNYVNGSTQRGGAFGFKLNSIPKMLELRQNEGKGTLLHYIVSFIEKKQPALLDIAAELPTLSAAARTTPLGQLTSDLAKLTGGLATIEKELSQHEESSSFYKQMSAFFETSNGKVEKLQQAFDGLKKSFSDVLKFYLEDATTDTESFFGGMQKFVTSINQARHDMKVWEQQEVAAAQSAERMKKLGVKTTPTKPGAGGVPGKPGAVVEKGSLDNMIASLKTGADQRMHRTSQRLTNPNKR